MGFPCYFPNVTSRKRCWCRLPKAIAIGTKRIEIKTAQTAATHHNQNKTQTAKRKIRQIKFTLTDPDYYDYERAEWYTTPRDTGERWIAGPFVDHSGTNEHILTLTLPVVRDGRFLGVAGADLAVGAIEAIAGAALAAIDADAAVLNHRGRVIATNTPRWMVGTLCPDDPTERHPGLGWSLVVAPGKATPREPRGE